MPMSADRRFAFVAWGSLGDVHPYVALAQAMHRRGHRVIFATHPLLEGMVRNAGLEFRPIGAHIDTEAVLHHPKLWDARKGFEIVWGSVAPLQRSIADLLLGLPGDTVIVAHPLVLPGAAMARDRQPGLRLIGSYLAPANLRSCEDPLWLGPLHVPRWLPHAVRRWLWRRVDADLLDPVTVPGINAQRAAMGLAPIVHYAEHLYAAPDHAFTFFPEWFCPTQPDWPRPLLRGDFPLFDGFPEAEANADLAAFLAAGEPPLAFTFGSAMVQADKAFRASVEACLRLGRRGILLTAFPDQLPRDLPPSVRWFDYVPFRRLLPQVAALVHHGGIGSTAEALRAGVPQLVVPMAHDQFDNAARVVALGVGATLPRPRYDGARVAKALAPLLASAEVRQRCRSAAAHFTDPHPVETLCGRIEAALSAMECRA